jgi:hypothetical protein
MNNVMIDSSMPRYVTRGLLVCLVLNVRQKMVSRRI